MDRERVPLIVVAGTTVVAIRTFAFHDEAINRFIELSI
jgi:hypothetical protein